MYNTAGEKILGWWLEQEVWYRGILQPPKRNNIISFGGIDIEDVDDDGFVNVLSEDNNWYTLQRKEIHLIEEE